MGHSWAGEVSDSLHLCNFNCFVSKMFAFFHLGEKNSTKYYMALYEVSMTICECL